MTINSWDINKIKFQGSHSEKNKMAAKWDVECSEKFCEEFNIVAAELYKPKAKFKEEPSFVEHHNNCVHKLHEYGWKINLKEPTYQVRMWLMVCFKLFSMWDM